MVRPVRVGFSSGSSWYGKYGTAGVAAPAVVQVPVDVGVEHGQR
jgi:hypothetical protein